MARGPQFHICKTGCWRHLRHWGLEGFTEFIPGSQQAPPASVQLPHRAAPAVPHAPPQSGGSPRGPNHRPSCCEALVTRSSCLQDPRRIARRAYPLRLSPHGREELSVSETAPLPHPAVPASLATRAWVLVAALSAGRWPLGGAVPPDSRPQADPLQHRGPVLAELSSVPARAPRAGPQPRPSQAPNLEAHPRVQCGKRVPGREVLVGVCAFVSMCRGWGG